MVSTQSINLSVTDDAEGSRQRDAALVERVLAGDRTQFVELLRPYEAAIYRLSFSILLSEEDAEDAAQDTALQAFVHLSRLSDPRKFKAWLFTIATNQARMIRRKKRAHLHHSISASQSQPDDGSELEMDFPDWRDLPSEAFSRREEARWLYAAADTLPAIYRDALWLQDLRQMSGKEAASTLGISLGAAKARLLRARTQLRERLRPVLGWPFAGREPFQKGENPWG